MVHGLLHLHGYIAVSYTHLGVYKRQTELFEVDPLSDNRKLYARAAEALGCLLYTSRERAPA